MEVSLRDIKELLLPNRVAEESPFEVGKCYLIRTVTHYLIGRVTKNYSEFVKLEDASWVADTGRFSECWEGDHNFKEVEKINSPSFVVGLGAVVDAGEWVHKLPAATK